MMMMMKMSPDFRFFFSHFSDNLSSLSSFWFYITNIYCSRVVGEIFFFFFVAPNYMILHCLCCYLLIFIKKIFQWLMIAECTSFMKFSVFFILLCLIDIFSKKFWTKFEIFDLKYLLLLLLLLFAVIQVNDYH